MKIDLTPADINTLRSLANAQRDVHLARVRFLKATADEGGKREREFCEERLEVLDALFEKLNAPLEKAARADKSQDPEPDEDEDEDEDS